MERSVLMPDELSGPHVQAALVCEKVLQEADGVLSFIRVVDRFTRPRPTQQIPPQVIQVMLAISLKAGGVGTGTYNIKIRLYKPNASVPSVDISSDVFFEGGQDRGVNIVHPLVLLADEEGLFWIDVLFEDAVLTRMPLRVIFVTMPAIQAPPQE
jgi:hypothetical protein